MASHGLDARKPSNISSASKDVLSRLADNPHMGRLSDTIRAGLRRHEHGSHVVIYKEHPDHVLIVAVVHGRSITGLRL
jgi:toxin ParE1/3/4